ncbi:MAG: (d)CMP kinase [Desulfocapsaceae bacterium]|nr:(d)CMP kinase [Desulfocapsaceae bacterium]
MTNKQQIITIDGPSGVGKSSVSRNLAAELGYVYLDTGAMYRAVALYFVRQQVAVDDEKQIAPGLTGIHLTLEPAASMEDDVGVFLNGDDVSEAIRTPELSMAASKISALPAVRSYLTAMQRTLAGKGKVIAEGRDMGTVVFPLAQHKFFLEADPRERCRRRVRQLKDKGVDVDEQEILSMILKRDNDDSTRALAPLKKAEDAYTIDTTSLSLDQVCSLILERIVNTARQG